MARHFLKTKLFLLLIALFCIVGTNTISAQTYEAGSEEANDFFGTTGENTPPTSLDTEFDRAAAEAGITNVSDIVPTAPTDTSTPKPPPALTSGPCSAENQKRSVFIGGSAEGDKAYRECQDKAAKEGEAAAADTNLFDSLVKGLEFLKTGPLRLVLFILAGIYQLAIIPILGMLVKIAAACLDLATQFTLNSKIITDADAAITSVWAIVRNIFNISFIFILLFTAIKTIIGSADANTKKTIANVVMAAILINFSLFITRILVDGGNILATALYNSATNNGTASMSIVISDILGLGAYFATTGIKCTVCTPFFIATALQVITMVTAIVILIYVTMLMLVRSIVLIFLMVLSPIGFMGDVLPQISEYSKMWWKNLFGQIAIAPIFLLLFFLIVKIGKGINPGVLAGEAAEYSVFFKYLLIIILLFVAGKITKKLSGEVGGLVEKFGTMAAGAAVGYATGGLSVLAKGSVGRAAGALATNEGLAEKAKQGGFGGFAARMTLKGADKTSKASFDVRNTDSFKEATDLIGEHTDLKVNYDRGLKIQKDGYQGMMKRRSESTEEIAKLIDKADVNLGEDEVKNIKKKREQENEDEIVKNDSEIRLLQANLPKLTNDDKARLKELTDKNKQLKDTKFADSDIESELKKAKKVERLNTYATNEERSRLNWMYRNRNDTKAAAKKIREAGKDKDAKALMEEAIKKMNEEEAKKSGKTPATPPPSTPPPTTPTPPKP